MTILAQLVDGLIDDTIRARLDDMRFVPQRLLSRGHYDVAEDVDMAELRAVAERVVGRDLTLVRGRCLRTRRGDYVLGKDDEAAGRIDVVADLSSTSSNDQGQLVYAYHGENFFAVPQRAGCVAVVDRREGVTRYDRYLGHTFGTVVYRVRLELI